MWNRSYRWQRGARLAAGALAIALAAIAAVFVSQTSAARRTARGASELAHELGAGSERLVEVVVPQTLGTVEGTLVYLDRADGIGQVVGRVVAVEAIDARQSRIRIRLMASRGETAIGGTIKGAPASLDLRDVLRLLISPDTPDEEVLLAREQIWPSVEEHVVPEMIDRLMAELSAKFADLDEQDRALLSDTVAQLRDELEPLEEELINRVATRSWETLGVSGLAKAILRSSGGTVKTKAQSAQDYLKELAGSKAAATPPSQGFLSDEDSEAVRVAIEDEILLFWRQHNAAILDAVGRVLSSRRAEFEAAFRERWAGGLYERAVVPAWTNGQDQVLAAVQTYANDFAARRLLTKQGGPRLLFAFALRSSLDISDRPLLVYRPEKGAERVTFEPYLP
jgi:hypothetical protein